MIKTGTVKVKRTTYDFYCDCCGKHIMSSTEYDDGWYETPNQNDIKFHLDRIGWLVLPLGILCDDCLNTKRKDVLNKLLDIGFEIRKNGMY